MKKCTLLLTLFALLGLAGCRNPFLMEMFGPKDVPLQNIIITNTRGQHVQSAFNTDVMFYDYTVDTNVRLKLVLGRSATVRWGFSNLTNGYTGEIAVPLAMGESKQILISVTGKRGAAKIYILSFTKTSAYYLTAGAASGGNGSYDSPFNTFSAALAAAASTSTKTVFVSGEINAAAGDGDSDSTFVVNNSGMFPIRFAGVNGAAAGLNGASGKRVLFVSGQSNIVFENIVIKGNDAASFTGEGGGIYIDTDALVTLGTGAIVQESGTGDGKGVYASGTLTLSGTTSPGRVAASGTDSGEVYLPEYKKIHLENNFAAPNGLILAKISTEIVPLEGSNVPVLAGLPADIQRAAANFKAADSAYQITSNGELALAGSTQSDEPQGSGIWYLAPAPNGKLDNSGIDSAHPFLTFEQALTAISSYAEGYSGPQTINVTGTLTAANAGTASNGSSVFLFNTAGTTEILIRGIGTSTLSSTDTRRVVEVTGNSKIRFESIIIKNTANSNQNGGGISVGASATVTLGTGADVQGRDTSSGNGKGVYAAGKLAFSNTGKVSGGDVYLPATQTVLIADALQPTNSTAAKITTAGTPSDTNHIQVLDGLYSLLLSQSKHFSPSINVYRVANVGKMMPNVFYVKSTGDNANDGETEYTALKTLKYAVEKAVGKATIIVADVLNNESENGGSTGGDSAFTVFTINNTNYEELLIKSGDSRDKKGLFADNCSKRVVRIESGSGPVKFESIELGNAEATVNGGGLYISSGATVTFGDNVTISGNAVKSASAAAQGGGVYVGGHLIISGDDVGITNNSVRGFVADNYGSMGGGVYIAGTGTLEISGNGVQLSYNTAYGFFPGAFNGSGGAGGGVYLASGGTFEITGENVEINENQAHSGTKKGGSGGGIFIDNATLTITGDAMHINSNKALGDVNADADTYGGGIYMQGGELIVTPPYSFANAKDAIIGYNTANCDFSNDAYPYPNYDGISDCSAYGGGIYMTNGAKAQMQFTNIIYNTALGCVSPYGAGNAYGGGIYNVFDWGNPNQDAVSIADGSGILIAMNAATAGAGSGRALGGGIYALDPSVFAFNTNTITDSWGSGGTRDNDHYEP